MASSNNTVSHRKRPRVDISSPPSSGRRSRPIATSSPVLAPVPSSSTRTSSNANRSTGSLSTENDSLVINHSAGTVTISQEAFNSFIENQDVLLSNQNDLKQRLEEVIIQNKQTRKIKPPRAVQAEVRNVYKELEKNGFSWRLGSYGFRAAENSEVNRRVLLGVKNIKPDVDDDMISEAMKTYFLSKRKKEKKENQGSYEDHKKKQSRKQRLYSKLNRRKLELNQSRSITDGDKALYASAMKVGYMSSEVSGSDDDGDEDPRKLLIISPLSWRSDLLNNLFKQLDNKHSERIRAKGMLERCKRKKGASSNRDYPANGPCFALIEFSSGEDEDEVVAPSVSDSVSTE